MAHLIFAHAKMIRGRCLKRAIEAKSIYLESQELSEKLSPEVETAAKEIYQSSYDLYLKKEFKEFEEILNIASELHDCFHGQKQKFYAITVRPRPGVTFEELHAAAVKYTNRACITGVYTSFEQKGTDETSLGEGFHVHFAIYGYTWRSKGEALRDTISTFGKYADKNCIEVKASKDDVDNYVNYYLIDYNSKDNHKEATKIWDDEWRKMKGLSNIYKGPLQPLSSSPVTVVVSDITPISINWD
jgi:hypothetical protein